MATLSRQLLQWATIGRSTQRSGSIRANISRSSRTIRSQTSWKVTIFSSEFRLWIWVTECLAASITLRWLMLFHTSLSRIWQDSIQWARIKTESGSRQRLETSTSITLRLVWQIYRFLTIPPTIMSWLMAPRYSIHRIKQLCHLAGQSLLYRARLRT